MLTILEDHSKYALVRFVAQKSEVSGELRTAIVMLERQLGHPVKALRSDGGGEYVAGSLQQFLQENSIVHQVSPPYHPQQNGATERLNRTLLDRARAMMPGPACPKPHGRRYSAVAASSEI
jgi:transposase InsO family protein